MTGFTSTYCLLDVMKGRKKLAKRLGEVGSKGGGTDSSPRIHTPIPFRDLLLSIARSTYSLGASHLSTRAKLAGEENSHVLPSQTIADSSTEKAA